MKILRIKGVILKANRKNLIPPPPFTGYGFTFIELLIVIAIIVVLSGLFITQYPAAQRRARDARRISDIRQYQTGLEVYANNNDGDYYVTSLINDSFCSAVGASACPQDPRSSSRDYNIRSTLSEYVIWAYLEDPPTSETYFVVCSTGRVGKTSTQPSGSSCPSGAWLP